MIKLEVKVGRVENLVITPVTSIVNTAIDSSRYKKNGETQGGGRGNKYRIVVSTYVCL